MTEIIMTGLAIASCLAIGLALYLLRGKSLEHRLSMLESITELSQRVAQLESAVHANATAPVERQLELLLNRVRELEGTIASDARESVVGVSTRESDETDEEFVIRVLANQGYAKIRMIGESNLAGGSTVVRVEASRGDLQLKGSVFIVNGKIGETRLTPIYELFP
ncbi:MAG: hypothetical protein HY286_03735 [Planctomycetes bacterium]|nr:hypothetical protein [Planctomycetota bacterium]